MSSPSWILLLSSALCLILCVHATTPTWEDQESGPFVGHLVKRDDRKPLISTEFGQVSGAKVGDGNETFLLHFITLEPNALFLPVMLHQDMLFYVHTGSGRLSFRGDNGMETMDVRRGDVFRLETGSVFFIQSHLGTTRQKLRIHAIFGDTGEDLRDPIPYGPYSSLRDLILGFDQRVLQETFKVPEEVIEEIRSAPKPDPITHGNASAQESGRSKGDYEFIESVLMSRSAVYGIFDPSNKDKKRKSNLYNFFSGKPDFENCNGWSSTLTKKKTSLLKDSKYGLFMVNLTHGGMMGPHWNPRATEIAVVLQGKGMVRVVCPGLISEAECKNARFAVEEGDIFVVPRFHPMAQLAFNNDTLVFMGFSTSPKNNHPQYLAGKASVLRTLDRHILATSFGVNETTFDRIVNQQGESVILECLSCAEEEFSILSEEIQREREEERRREEEETRRKEEERRRQEEEAKRKEEEEAKRREEEAARKREEEERKKREQEEAARRQKEAEEAERRREEEERERQQQQQEQEQQRREQEEREARQRQAEEERQRQQQQEAQRREQEEREARQREEEAQRQKQQQEEEAARRRRQEQEAREAAAAAAREAEQEREAAARREEEAARRQEQEAQRRQQEEAGQGRGGGAGERQEGGEAAARREEEAARQEGQPTPEQQ
ncbi:OLC1v1010805C1 [Oldenlandia corymbosa var. corymbosa]|uniref:OLC1v1010805C1 n=1 Tax=Oldenlandia corymbosa var. corymbosa TaxID=529605 RepID=A0AAV1DUN2_OLDCO|nr:OLC1v1010805C1 [Oldenlandia corymbosa var. corymbosa]